MRIPQCAPGELPGGKRDQFCNWKVAGGERHIAYVAGFTKWVIAHPSDRGTKPCLHWMTQGELPCKFCAANKCPCELGYVPLYRGIDARPMLAIVYSAERGTIDALELFDRVTVGREREKGAQIWIRRTMEQEPKWTTTLPHRKCAASPDASLLVLWGMPELVAWLQQTAGSDNAVSPAPAPAPAPALPKKTGPTPPVVRVYGGPEPADVPDTFGAVINRIKEKAGALDAKPSANGKHGARKGEGHE